MHRPDRPESDWIENALALATVVVIVGLVLIEQLVGWPEALTLQGYLRRE
jgi:hypothetical protein